MANKRQRTASIGACYNSSDTSSNYRAPQKLRVPTDEESWNEICRNHHVGAHENDAAGNLAFPTGLNLFSSAMPRPLPSSTVLLAMQPKLNVAVHGHVTEGITRRGLAMPLLQPLQHLFVSSKKPGPTQAASAVHDIAEAESEKEIAPSTVLGGRPEQPSVTDALTDPDSSTLTKGQQKRYLQLQHEQVTQKASGWTPARRKEYRKLRKLVQAEQVLYRAALTSFYHQTGIDRFQMGIPSPFAEYNGHMAKRYMEAYRERQEEEGAAEILPMVYGKCRQVVSLLHVSREICLLHHTKNRKRRSVDAYQGTELLTTGDNDLLPPVNVAQRLPAGSILAPPLPDRIPHLGLLRHDQTTLSLARQHNVNLVTTTETLHALLQLPGDEGAQWRIPLRKEEGLVIVDMPLPGPSNPRQCLSSGVQEALYQSLSSDSKPAYSYAIMTFPIAQGKAKQSSCRVLVRCRSRVQECQTKGKVHPISLFPKLEYFCDRGWNETFTSFDKALWILEKILQPSSRVWVAHVDPSQFKLLRCEETGVAHALAGDHETWIDNPEGTDPMDHLEAMAELLRATQRMPEGELLLQLSGTSVSVHMAEKTCHGGSHGIKNVSKLDVSAIVAECGGVVYTGPAALRQCVRTFQWNEDRIPYTFPINEEGRKPASIS